MIDADNIFDQPVKVILEHMITYEKLWRVKLITQLWDDSNRLN